MNNIRLHGQQPYTVVAVHGGPGGIGEARPLAEELARDYGVIEPFLLADSLEGQIEDLKSAIDQYGHTPVTLIGHSYGAMLSYIFAARFPDLVGKLILVSSGVLEREEAEMTNVTRLSRLSDEQKSELENARNTYLNATGEAQKQAFVELFTLIQRTDAYNLIPHESDLVIVEPEHYGSVWSGMQALLDSGKLIEHGKDIKCPIIVIHGAYDPRSGEGIKQSLSKYVPDFTFILLEKCGHYPWYEKEAREEFFLELRKNL